MRRFGLALVLLLGACDDDEAEPATCADWLRCYDLCNPWSSPDPRSQISACEQQCREDLDFKTDDPSPEFDTPSVEIRGSWFAIVLTELQAAQFIHTDDLPDYAEAGRRFEEALAERGRCVRPLF